MGGPNGYLARYVARKWCTVPVHRPDPETTSCSCGKADCAKPGKHPDGRFWPAGSADPDHFADRNIGVRLGPDSGDLADVDLDCGEAVVVGPALLPPTDSAFGRAERVTHALYTVPARDAAYLKLQDPVLSGDRATIVELRWPEWDEDEKAFKNLQTVFPPSLHHTGGTVAWLRDGAPAAVAGADLVAAVRHVGAAVLLARYAKPKERHALVLLQANLLVRAGWNDDTKVVGFIAAVFTARNDADKAAKVADGEGLGAVRDARKRLKTNKAMTGLPALQAMLDPALDTRTAEKVVARVKEWLGVPDPTGPKVTIGGGQAGGAPGPARRYTPLPPWRPFPVEHLPGAVREFVATVSAAMRCDPTFVALPALAVCGGMIGSTRTVRLKRSWHEPAMIWAVVVGESGTLKTPPYKRAVAPVVAMQAAHIQANRAATAAYRTELREYERQKKKARDDDPGDPPVEPPCTRIYSRDTTIEALSGLLVDNKTRFLIGRDELSGWLSSFNQYKSKGGSDLANWLELHGLGTLCVDRKTGEPRTIFISDVGVSLCGGIQPGVLRLALTPQHFSAGVPARLLFAYPPRKPKEWTEDDIDEAAEANYHRLVKDLSELESHTDEDDVPYPMALGLTAEAKAEWVRFYGQFAAKQAATEGELAAAFSKLEGYAARLALVHHVCRSVSAGGRGLEPVGVGSVRAGIALAAWFTYEAERVYQMLGEETAEQETRALVEAVARLAEGCGGRLTARQLQKSNNRKYRSSDEAEAALGSLVALGLGRWEDGPAPERGGHRARLFVPCTPHDTSDTRPDADPPDDPDDEGGPHDTRPDAPEPPAGGGAGDGAPNPCGASTCGGEPDGRGGRVSDVSCGVQGEADGNEPTGLVAAAVVECRAAAGSSVVRDATAVPQTVVSEPAGLQPVVQALRGWSGLIGLDIETTGLERARDRARLLSLATPRGTYLIDLFRVDPTPLWPALAAAEVVGHNLGFDLPFLMRLGFVPGRVRDTMLASQVLHAGNRAVGHSLKEVAHRHLGVVVDKELQTADWSGSLSAAHLEYAARDAELPPALWEKLTADVATANLAATVETEMAALPAVAWAAASGVGFDRAAWEAVAAETEACAGRLRERLDELVPNGGNLFGVTNWNSPDAVAAAFAARGVALTSTDDDALAALDHPAAAVLREYRAASKLSGTYGREWLRHVAPDGRVYATWKQIGAGASGRMSCKGPNLQQLPRDPRYRRCVVAPPGRALVKADYSQIELRIAAKITGDRRMLDAYRRGEDLHTTTARAVLGTAEVTKGDRQLAKSLNFGLLYGMGAKALAAYAASNFGVVLTPAEAGRHRDAFFRTYPGLRSWHRAVPAGVLQTRTLAGRRRVGVGAFTEKLNTPVQGTGADGLKRALALLWERRAACPGAFPVLLVHDEIVVECDEARQEEAAVWLRGAMTDGMAPLLDPVPVEVEVSAGRTWGG